MINFYNPLSPISAFPIRVGVGPFHWGMTNLSMALSPKETDSAKISSAKGGASYVPPPPCRNADWLGLQHPAGDISGNLTGLHGTGDTTDADRQTYRTAGSGWAARWWKPPTMY